MPPKNSAYMIRTSTLLIIVVILRVRVGHEALHARPQPGAEPAPTGQHERPDRERQPIRVPHGLYDGPDGDREDDGEDVDEAAADAAHGFGTVFRLEGPYRPHGATHCLPLRTRAGRCGRSTTGTAGCPHRR